MLKVCNEKKFRDQHVRRGKGGTENTTGGNAVLYQWQAYFYPTQYHAYFWCCVRTQ